jgi:predicted amidohydrolase YtcJ
MSNLTRRSFLATVAGGVAALATPLGRAAAGGNGLMGMAGEVDQIFVNGKFITMSADDATVEAVAVRGGKVAAVGTAQDMRALAGASTSIIDLGGKCVTPGLVDSHIHLLYYGQQFRKDLLDIRFPKAQTKDELLRLVEMRAMEVPPGKWIAGNQGFSLTVGDAPNRKELDAVAPNNPVYLRHSSGQFAVVNSLALREAGIDRHTRDPYGAKIGRDADSGEPNGFLFHYPAENLVGRKIPAFNARSEADRLDNAKEGQRRALAAGYTSAQDVIVYTEEDVEAYRRLAREGGLQMRVYIMQYLPTEHHALKLVPRARHFKDEWLTFGGWKLALDGGPAAGTILMYDRSLPAAKRSYLYHDQRTLDRIVLQAHKTGAQVSFHAVGDRAIDMAINSVEAALNAAPRENHRHRIEHLLFPTQQALERMKQLGMVASVQPQWITFYSDGYRRLTNDATMERFLPLKTMIEMGIPIAFGCDVPATPMIEPKWAFLGAVARQTRSGYVPAPEQRISIHDALRIHTLGSAYASFEEHTKGSLEPGKVADMVVWSHDLYTASPRELRELTALATIVDGKVVHG